MVGGRQADCEVKRWQGRTRVRIRSYVGGGMHGWAVAASQRCIRAYAGRGEVGLKKLAWRAGSPACAQRGRDVSSTQTMHRSSVHPRLAEQSWLHVVDFSLCGGIFSSLLFITFQCRLCCIHKSNNTQTKSALKQVIF